MGMRTETREEAISGHPDQTVLVSAGAHSPERTNNTQPRVNAMPLAFGIILVY